MGQLTNHVIDRAGHFLISLPGPAMDLMDGLPGVNASDDDFGINSPAP
jgi:hypothetical protein